MLPCSFPARHALTLVLIAATTLTVGCGSLTKGSQEAPAFPMGQRVQVGTLTYNVLEAGWKSQLDGTTRIPKERFLVLKISITNGGGSQVAIPIFSIEGANGASHMEEIVGVENVPQWLGSFRTIEPTENEQGSIVFDAPMAAYKLRVTDGGDIGQERTALIEIPVHLE